MIIRMEHPKHGRMHVYDLQEKQRAESAGWTEVVKNKLLTSDELSERIKVSIEEVKAEIKRKPGRPRKKD